jgi:hypothetical protein
MRVGKIISLVAGILLVLIALGLVVPGAVLLGVYGSQKGSDGFFETSTRTMSTTGYALVTPDAEVNMGPLVGDWAPTGDRAALRLRATSNLEGSAFIGIGPSAEVSQYLAGVDYDEVTDLGWMWEEVKYRHLDGGAPAAPPGEQDFWVASEEGTGELTLDWDIQSGNWTAVVMNADASAPVNAGVSLGARFDILLPIGIGMTVAGVVLLILGIVFIVLGARRSPSPAAVQPQTPPPPAEK